ncbi:tyrosine-type recombinase/integrase [Sphingomonas aerolata]|uniref:tyrosine-type recombinase/integrase n=1 Tax=Sphingomonas aerolata TaxID=185951 RepID=UPI003A5BC9FB
MPENCGMPHDCCFGPGSTRRSSESSARPRSLPNRSACSSRSPERGTISQKATWSPRYAAKTLASMEKDVFPSLGNVPIGSITVPMVLKALRAVEERAAIETAHRLRQHMSEIFLYAIGAGLTDTDPAHVVKPALLPMTKGRRPAVRLASEATAVLARVEAMDAFPATKLASRLLALTAARPGVVRMAAPQEFEGLDSTTPLWRVPAEKMKLTVERKNDADFEFVIPLSPPTSDGSVDFTTKLIAFDQDRVSLPSMSTPQTSPAAIVPQASALVIYSA